MEVINGHLSIFKDTSNDEFAHTVSDGVLLVLFFPDEAVHGDVSDLNEESVKVGFSFVRLHVEQDEGLGNGACLLVLSGFLLLLFFLNKLLGFLLIINKTPIK